MRPSDLHWTLISERSYRIAAEAIRCLQRHNVNYVLSGGWAVFVYDPSTPSVDFDAFLSNGFPKPVADDLTAMGFQIGARQEIEALPLDEPCELLGTGDPDLGIPHLSYIPAKLFKDNIEERPLQLGGETFTVPVPARAALAITKLGALRARSIGYAMFEDAAVLALLDPSTATTMKALPQGYFRRKAGKDLFDVSLLLANEENLIACRNLASRFGLWSSLAERLGQTSPAIVATARDMATRVGARDPSRLLSLR